MSRHSTLDHISKTMISYSRESAGHDPPYCRQLVAIMNPRIRNIESEIPDVEVEIEAEGDDPTLGEGSPLPATD